MPRALLVLFLIAGCGSARYVRAGSASPDHVSFPRSPHTLVLVSPGGELASVTHPLCTLDVCVEGLRYQLEHGVDAAISELSYWPRPGAQPDYAYALTDVDVTTHVLRDHRRTEGLSVEMRWAFVVRDERHGTDVIELHDTETAVATPNGVGHCLDILEHRAVSRIQSEVAAWLAALPS